MFLKARSLENHYATKQTSSAKHAEHSDTSQNFSLQYCEAEISMASRSSIFDLSDLKFGM